MLGRFLIYTTKRARTTVLGKPFACSSYRQGACVSSAAEVPMKNAQAEKRHGAEAGCRPHEVGGSI